MWRSRLRIFRSILSRKHTESQDLWCCVKCERYSRSEAAMWSPTHPSVDISVVAQGGDGIDARRAARGEIRRGRRGCDHEQYSAPIGQAVEHVDTHEVCREKAGHTERQHAAQRDPEA